MNNIDKLMQLEQAANEYGFSWENADQILAQIESECQEVKSELDKPVAPNQQIDLQTEIGDLLHAAFSLCIHCGFDPEETVKQSTEKFAKRFDKVKHLALADGHVDLKGKPFSTLMKYWQKAKS
jgi:uncharacterized protein YabN with tetrapyrrole methylase and pyrophosphatase domain